MHVHHPTRFTRRLIAASACLGAVTGAVGTAAAAPPPPPGTVTDIASGLAGPLQIDIGRAQFVYVAESFSGTLRSIDRRGNVSEPLAVNPTGEIGGVAARGNTVAYTTNDRDENFEAIASTLVVMRGHKATMTVDLLEYEQVNNLDQDNTYGFESIDPDCATQLPPELGPPTYNGIVDSHPYAIANAPGGGWYIAEAGGNAILQVSRGGDITTVAVLPPQPFVVTEEAAAATGMPECAIGLTYNFEPVPTDVEVGDDGALYVTTLPGGPEDPSLGPRGSVYRIDPASGATELVATGFMTPVNLALGDGEIYVSELFGGRVVRVTPQGPVTVAELLNPAGLEWSRGRLYVSYNAFTDGTVATISLG